MKNILLLILIFSSFIANSQTWNELAKSLPVPHVMNEYSNLGSSIAIDGDYAVIGASSYFNEQGLAYVFYFDGENWIFQAKLTCTNAEVGDEFGKSVGISGDHIVVGAPFDDDDGYSSGSAYVYTKTGVSWSDMTETAALTNSDATDHDCFGGSVSISGDHIVVCASGVSSDLGAAYVFSKPGAVWSNMNETGKLTASDGEGGFYGHKFGSSVSISGDNIVVGASKGDGNTGASGAAYVFTKEDVGWGNMTETAKLTASDGNIRDYFGTSVSISGDHIVVGSPEDHNGYSDTGSAYVFSKSGLVWTDMTETAKLIASNLTALLNFGISVNISGNNIIIGVLYEGIYTNYRTAYVFTKVGYSWTDMTETARLRPSDGILSDHFGLNVAISGDHVLIGAQGANNGSGAFYTYTKPVSGWAQSYENEKKISPEEFGNIQDNYGFSVAIDSNYAVIGAKGYNGSKGRVSVLYFDGTDWELQAQLTASDGSKGDFFGESVSISGNSIVVGAQNANNGIGAAYVFTKEGDVWSNMAETRILTTSSLTTHDNFGSSVSISGDNIVVGADVSYSEVSEAAYVFTKTGSSWSNLPMFAKLTASDQVTFNFFGESVSISGNSIVVGAHQANNSFGAAYVFVKEGDAWSNMTETAKLTVSDAYSYDDFGSSVSISGNQIVVGANRHNSAYVFTREGNVWNNMTETAKLTPSDASYQDSFGSFVSISGNYIAVGAPNDDDNGSESGSVYLFLKQGDIWTSMTETEKIISLDGDAGDVFGKSVCLSGSYLLVGASNDNDNGYKSGSAYWLRKCREFNEITVSTCNSYTAPSGAIYSTSGIYIDVIPSSENCDSIITINLTVDYSTTSTDIQMACESYTWIDGNIYTESNNTATHTLTNVVGCDSIITLDLTILNNTGTDIQMACESYTWMDGNTYTESNSTVTHTLTNVAGCDSVVTLDLTILNDAVTDIQMACESYTWMDGNIYTESNNSATQTFTNAAGCDSVVTLDLTINHANIGVDVQTACESYTWMDGNTYTENNNIAIHILTNVGGCDSIVTLNLSINHANTGIDVQTACEFYTWKDGNTYTENNNTATYTSTNVGGCDSVVTLDLTIFHSSSGVDFQTACDSYTWINGETYTVTAMKATDTLINAVGCDSVVLLDLHIINSSSSVDVHTACESYTWVDGITYFESNNSATDTLTNTAGCDSIITLDLTLLKNTGIDVQTTCEAYTWIDGNIYTENNNSATQTFTNAAGCDSVVTLDLTFNKPDITVTSTDTSISSNDVNATYRWLDCGDSTVVLGETGPTFLPLNNGDYAVEITRNSCVDTSSCIAITKIKVFDRNHVSIYPNPTEGKITIYCLGLEQIEIVDITGKTVKQYTSEKDQMMIDLSNQSKGIYLVKVFAGKEISNQKLILID